MSSIDSIDALLENWDANFAALQEIVAYIEKQGTPGAEKLASAAGAAAGAAAGENVLRGAEFSGACRRNAARRHEPGRRARNSPARNRRREPYLFLKAPSTLCGAYDDIAIPTGLKKIDWEAEIALAIGKRGKRIKAERALDHVAGFMTTNDVSARDLQVRADRPGLRSDWLNGKSHDNFAPMGPFWCRAPSWRTT